MKITISGGTYRSEEEAVARAIIHTLRQFGVEVDDRIEFRSHPTHQIILRSLAAEGFPVTVEIAK